MLVRGTVSDNHAAAAHPNGNIGRQPDYNRDLTHSHGRGSADVIPIAFAAPVNSVADWDRSPLERRPNAERRNQILR
jgi:hypothetical protein